MSNSTRREAERITAEVAKICGCNWESCTAVRTATTDAIDAALQARDERAAKIAESHSATDCDGPDCGVVIAAAIRKDD